MDLSGVQRETRRTLLTVTAFPLAQQCFGRFLSLTAPALAVFASSLGGIILVLGAAAVLW